jgi:alpha-L-rhamnosidase
VFISAPASSTAVDGLRVDGRPSPALGVDAVTPRLAWRLPTDVRGASATVVEAARTVADLLERRSLLFSSELPLSDQAFRVPGGLITLDETVHWRVGLRGSEQQSAASVSWSDTATFETAPALLSFAGSWISSAEWSRPAPEYNGPPPVFARDIDIDGPIARARLALAAPGSVEVRINDSVPNDEVLGFGYSVESVRLPARMLDIGSLLVPGRNALRITVAGGASWVPPTSDGRYTKLSTSAMPPRLLARLVIDYEDGRSIEIGSDETWRTTTGPVRMSHWYGGEDIDARLSNAVGTIDDTWDAAVIVGPARLHELWWARRPPLRIVERIPGTAVAHSADGNTTIFDFGVNVAGWPEIALSGGLDGQRLEMRPAELLADGALDQRTVGSPIWDSYLARSGDQLWHPRHIYHGFRYVEVTGACAEQLTAHAAVIRAVNEPAGTLETDDAFIATLHRIIDRAVQGNMYSVFTDCPSREKLGWIEQLHLCFGLLARSYDVEAHLRDSLDLMRDAQHPGGLIPSIVPQTTDFSGNEWNGDPDGFVDDVNWGGAIAFVSWEHYREYGDLRVLEENWQAILRYLDHLRARSVGDLLDFGLGDWVALDTSTPSSMVASYGYIRLLHTTADIAAALGENDARADLDGRADSVTARFVEAFGGEGTAWGSGSQASIALALDIGAVADEHINTVVARLLDTIDAADGQLTVGENSWPALLRVLHRLGRDDLIDHMVRADDGPGYGLQIRLGATALAETWRGASGAMYENSQNHFMLGMIHDWIAVDMIGLGQASDSIGWRSATIRPQPTAEARRGAITQATTRGTFSLEWNLEERRLIAEIPASARASITVPDDWDFGPEAAVDLEAGRWEWSA